MKKLLFVIDSLSSGGAEKSLISLLSLLDYKKYQVDLLMFSQKGLYTTLLPREVNVLPVPLFIKLQEDGIKSQLQKGKVQKVLLRLGASISLRNPIIKKKYHPAQINWNWITRGIKSLDQIYDVAIAYSQGTPTYFVCEKVSANKKFAWVNTDYKKAAYNMNYDAKFYQKLTNVIAVSELNKDILLKELPLLKDKTSVIYDIISPNLIKSMAKHSGGFIDDFQGIRILTIGRLVKSKGYDLAIGASKKLRDQGVKHKWYVIGEGVLKSEIQEMISKFKLENNFILLGTHQNPYTYLNQCDIYVQPSRFEGYGLAIAEARILNKPIIATNFDVVYDQLVDKNNGLIVKMNSEALFTGIKTMIEDNQLREHLIRQLKDEQVGTESEIHKLYKLIG